MDAARSPYRADIDGLRAVAVAAVVLYHATGRALPGGFIGVDIFFVISGYLITGILLRTLDDGSFSITDFYVRRIRRIFPALTVVLAACLAMGWLVLLPRELETLGGDTAAGAGFVANLRFALHTNYFGPVAHERVLLHLWSLGVEEQYYLLWPLLLWVAWKLAPRARMLAIVGLFVASVAYSVQLSFTDATAAFYSPVARTWELLLGALVAYGGVRYGHSVGYRSQTARRSGFAARVEHLSPRTRAHMYEGFAISGAALIAIALMTLSAESVFPGLWALLPTVGAALLIAAGPDTWINRVLLSNRALVGLGLISYPLYLWHWPILVWLRLQSPEATPLMLAVAMLSAVALSFATWRLVELPLRRVATRRLVPALCTAQLGLFGAGLLLVQGDGFPERGDALNRRIFAASITAERDHLWTSRNDCFLDLSETEAQLPRSCVEPASKPQRRLRVFLWGDSFAAHLSSGIRHVLGDTVDLLQVTTSGCAPLPVRRAGEQRRCEDVNRYALLRIAATRPDIVVIGARWSAAADYARIEATVNAIRALGVGQVLLLGASPEYATSVPRLLLRARAQGVVPSRLQPPQIARLRQIDSVLAMVAARSGAAFASPLAAQCTPDGCLVDVDSPSGGITTFDDAHLTRFGSRYVMERLLLPVFADVQIVWLAKGPT